MDKQVRDKNHQFIRKLKKDIMLNVIHLTELGLYSYGFEVSDKQICPEYVRRLKNELSGLGFTCDVNKSHYTYQFYVNWEVMKIS